MAEKRLSQVELASHIGKGKTTLNQWIKFDRIPPADYALKIADFLGEDLRFLLTGTHTDDYTFIRSNPALKTVIDLLKDKEQDVIEMALVGIRAILEVEMMKNTKKSSEDIA